MLSSALFGWSALLALVPASILPWRRLGTTQARDASFWAVTAVAIAGPACWTVVQLAGSWRTGFSVALWVTIAVTMLTFAGAAAVTRQAWRLLPLLLPYLVLLALIALVWQRAPEQPLSPAAPVGWLEVHIAVSVLTYALATLAAVAGLAVFLQERALKNRRPTALSHHLPSVADSERLLVGLLLAAGFVLLAGILTGISLQYLEGSLLRLDHKTLLSILSFLVIVGLLAAHYRTGVRGRRAARYVLLGYLLLTLAYPGVKFVKDVIIG